MGVSQTDPETEPDASPGARAGAKVDAAAVAAAIGAVRPRSRRRWWILAVVVVVLAAAAITGAVVVSGRNEDAPVEAVRAYVDAIARGDARAANALVDPKSFGTGVDPALLTDELLRSAKQRITVDDVAVDFSSDLDADVIEVDVDYFLAGRQFSVTLRAKRAGTTAGLLHEWRVIDPLLVPVLAQTNEPRLETARFGAGTVPVSGTEYGGFPQRRFFVYPGVYELGGHPSRYLSAPPKDVVAANLDYGARPADSADYDVTGVVYYQATTELKDTLTDRMVDHAAACVAAVPKAPANCPYTILSSADLVTSMRVDRQPAVGSIQTYQVDYDGERTEPSLRMMSVPGTFAYTDIDGAKGTELFTVYARIVVTPDDELTITFTMEL
jgi:hypothetical protein